MVNAVTVFKRTCFLKPNFYLETVSSRENFDKTSFSNSWTINIIDLNFDFDKGV